MTTPRACIVCGGSDIAPRYDVLHRCTRCGHSWADVDLTAEALEELYGRAYFHGNEYTNYTADAGVLRKNFALRLKVLDRFLDPRRHRRLCEIGCAYGYFLEAARSRFDTVSGIDISEDAVRFARERLHLDVRQGDLLAADLAGREYDVVCMWDTIEHLTRPDRYVEALAACMKPGALLALTTGDISSLNARIQGARWRLIHPPTHVHYFTRRSLERMLGRLGFDIRYAGYCGFHRSVGGMLDGLSRERAGVSRVLSGLFRLARNGPLARQSIYLNLRDIVFVIAARR